MYELILLTVMDVCAEVSCSFARIEVLQHIYFFTAFKFVNVYINVYIDVFIFSNLNALIMETEIFEALISKIFIDNTKNTYYICVCMCVYIYISCLKMPRYCLEHFWTLYAFLFLNCSAQGLPWWLSGKESPADATDMGLIPNPGRSHMRSN